ncbi:hypothetical protein ACQ4M4_18820 [Leptolyngbya sp. AN02str]|uniref:hypothetical protein n=1 Tax=Leptolyngbya sp. AN02str TaxID=3423363 RepID=UPI003D3143CF
MPVTHLCLSIKQIARWSVVGAIASLVIGCTHVSTDLPSRRLQVQQTWQLQPGQQVAGHRIEGGIGDVSVALQGRSVFAPFAGKTQRIQHPNCIAFSSPELPAYVLRLCGLRRPKLGSVAQGEAIGQGRSLQFATLRKQPDGTWAFVEPSVRLLEQLLSQP